MLTDRTLFNIKELENFSRRLNEKHSKMMDSWIRKSFFKKYPKERVRKNLKNPNEEALVYTYDFKFEEQNVVNLF